MLMGECVCCEISWSVHVANDILTRVSQVLLQLSCGDFALVLRIKAAVEQYLLCGILYGNLWWQLQLTGFRLLIVCVI